MAESPTPAPFGGSGDLWGTTWTYSDVNNSGFGLAISAQLVGSGGVTVYFPITISVSYTLAPGFLVSQDAVVYANESAELRWDGMFRAAPTGSVYGLVSQVTGDLPRLPPSGDEERPVQLFVKPTRGDTNTLPDSGLDGFTVQVRYRPTWISRP